jgi:hypothetical protein
VGINAAGATANRIQGLALNFGGPSTSSGRTVMTGGLDAATYLHGNHVIKFGGE